jgi:hypothetical protein
MSLKEDTFLLHVSLRIKTCPSHAASDRLLLLPLYRFSLQGVRAWLGEEKPALCLVSKSTQYFGKASARRDQFGPFLLSAPYSSVIDLFRLAVNAILLQENADLGSGSQYASSRAPSRSTTIQLREPQTSLISLSLQRYVVCCGDGSAQCPLENNLPVRRQGFHWVSPPRVVVEVPARTQAFDMRLHARYEFPLRPDTSPYSAWIDQTVSFGSAIVPVTKSCSRSL